MITNGLQGVGTRLHTTNEDGFLTLVAMLGRTTGSGPPEQHDPAANGRVWFRVNIGTRIHELWMPAQSPDGIAKAFVTSSLLWPHPQR